MKRERPRVVWVSGASSGMGEAIAATFARHGDVVVATARNLGKLRKLRTTHPGVFDLRRCDVRRETEVRRVGRAILDKHGVVDILVNNAGVTYFKDVLSTSVKEFDHVLDTNLRGTFLTTKAILPSMLRRTRGMIITIVSYAAKTIYTNSAAYSASKSGTEALMNVLRAEVRRKNIKIVNVYPGAVLTHMWSREQRKANARRMVSAGDVANLLYEVSRQPESVVVEEIIIRPQGGDVEV